MDKIAFVDYCRAQLTQVFSSTRDGKPDNKLKHRTEGVMLAGEMLGVISRAEASALIEQTHYDVFGESTADRAERKKHLNELKALSPDDYFDIPAIERRK